MSAQQIKINEARKAFNRAFYGNGSVTDKIRAAYECSIAFDQCYRHTEAMIFEKIGNYWYMQQDKFKTIVEEPDETI